MYASHSDEPLRNKSMSSDEDARRISVDHETIIYYSLIVWKKGLNTASKCMPFTMNEIFTCTCDFLIIL